MAADTGALELKSGSCHLPLQKNFVSFRLFSGQNSSELLSASADEPPEVFGVRGCPAAKVDFQVCGNTICSENWALEIGASLEFGFCSLVLSRAERPRPVDLNCADLTFSS